MIDYESSRLPDLCAACGAELLLTPSGHRFCGDPSCTDGFNIANPARELYKLLEDVINGRPIKRENKRHH